MANRLSLTTTAVLLFGLLQSSALAAPLEQISSAEQQQQQQGSLEYALKRSLKLPLDEGGLEDLLLESRSRRSSSGLGSSFIRYGRNSKTIDEVSQPHTRSDIIIRYGRDELKNRLARLRQERMQRLARLALVCANKSQEDLSLSSAEDRIIREMCRDAPLHPTVPDFV